MPDVLIRDVPAGVLRWMDERADHLRLSRSEMLRRELVQWAGMGEATTIEDADWEAFDETFADLSDADVMARAWR